MPKRSTSTPVRVTYIALVPHVESGGCITIRCTKLSRHLTDALRRSRAQSASLVGRCGEDSPGLSSLVANPETRLTNLAQRGQSRRAWLCVCGHERKAHQHYRRGTDCALCDCKRWRLWWNFRQLQGLGSSDSTGDPEDGTPQ
jgi:hypothetical protein